MNLLWVATLLTAIGVAIFVVRMRSHFPMPLRDYLWHPIGGLIFIGIILNSAYRHTWRRGVVWKGRRYRDVDSVA